VNLIPSLWDESKSGSRRSDRAQRVGGEGAVWKSVDSSLLSTSFYRHNQLTSNGNDLDACGVGFSKSPNTDSISFPTPSFPNQGLSSGYSSNSNSLTRTPNHAPSPPASSTMLHRPLTSSSESGSQSTASLVSSIQLTIQPPTVSPISPLLRRCVADLGHAVSAASSNGGGGGGGDKSSGNDRSRRR